MSGRITKKKLVREYFDLAFLQFSSGLLTDSFASTGDKSEEMLKLSMAGRDESLGALRKIKDDFADFCKINGLVTEADTRAKVIDRVLQEVCGWPETAFRREVHAERGYIDYVLSIRGRQLIAVEAKREGLPFLMPAGRARSLKLSGALLTDTAVKDAISQVRGYCDDAVIRYAVATNGYAWIVFRALREDVHWREGAAIVFRSLDDIADNFTAFWNLLGYAAVMEGYLDAQFTQPDVQLANCIWS
jgi:hypothetical protein